MCRRGLYSGSSRVGLGLGLVPPTCHLPDMVIYDVGGGYTLAPRGHGTRKPRPRPQLPMRRPPRKMHFQKMQNRSNREPIRNSAF
jgi:hypothetical protein